MRTLLTAVTFLCAVFSTLPSNAFTPAVGIPERSCGKVDASGRCTGPVPDADPSENWTEYVSAPETMSDFERRLNRMQQLTLAIARGEPGALKAYLQALRDPPSFTPPTMPRPNVVPDDKLGATDLWANIDEYMRLREQWDRENPPPRTQPLQGANGGGGNGGGSGDNIEGECHFEGPLDNDTFICWRVDQAYRISTNCEPSHRGRYRGLPVRYCDGA